MTTSSTLSSSICKNCNKFFIDLIHCSQAYFFVHPVPRVTTSASDYGGGQKTKNEYHTCLGDTGLGFKWQPEYNLLGSSSATCYICHMLVLAAQGKQHHHPATIETHSFDKSSKSLKSSVLNIFHGRFKIEPLEGKNDPSTFYCWPIMLGKKANLD